MRFCDSGKPNLALLQRTALRRNGPRGAEVPSIGGGALSYAFSGALARDGGAGSARAAMGDSDEAAPTVHSRRGEPA